MANCSINRVNLDKDGNDLVATIAAAGAERFAFYVMRNEERIHTQWYGSAPRIRFSTQGAPGLYRVLAFAESADGTKLTKYSNPVFLHPGVFTRKTRIRPSAENRALYLQGRHWKFPALYFSHASPRLFVMLSAAAQREKYRLPIFNRWTWASKFPGHVLCVSDPTLELDEEMRLGWYLGTHNHDAGEELCALVRRFAKALGIREDAIVFWGSSGGGFAALALAHRLDGSTAVAINAQTDALAYHVEQDVDRVRNACFAGLGVDDIRQRFRMRVDMTHAWRGATRSKAILLQNKRDLHHYQDHFLPFWEAIGGSGENGRSGNGRHLAWLYEDSTGHGPESEAMVPEILRMVDELS